MHDTVAAKDLLFRRLKCLSNYENANKVNIVLHFALTKFPKKLCKADYLYFHFCGIPFPIEFRSGACKKSRHSSGRNGAAKGSSAIRKNIRTCKGNKLQRI